jgi:hypothetical protein
MRNIDLTAAAAARPTGQRRQAAIPEIRPTLENSVKLTGYVFRPGHSNTTPA